MATTRHYEDPRGSHLPALEQNILRYRAIEMVLALFYAEDLRKAIIGCVQTTDRLRNRLDDKVGQHERVPAGAKKPLQKALKALAADQVFTEDEMIQIEKLIDYRNDIAHRLEELNADISLPHGLQGTVYGFALLQSHNMTMRLQKDYVSIGDY